MHKISANHIYSYSVLLLQKMDNSHNVFSYSADILWTILHFILCWFSAHHSARFIPGLPSKSWGWIAVISLLNYLDNSFRLSTSDLQNLHHTFYLFYGSSLVGSFLTKASVSIVIHWGLSSPKSRDVLWYSFLVACERNQPIRTVISHKWNRNTLKISFALRYSIMDSLHTVHKHKVGKWTNESSDCFELHVDFT